MMRQGIGDNTSAIAARMVNAQPYPSLSARGGTVKGKKAPMRQRVMRTADMAEAENLPKASVMNVIIGTMEKMTEMQSSEQFDKKTKTFVCTSAVHP